MQRRSSNEIIEFYFFCDFSQLMCSGVMKYLSAYLLCTLGGNAAPTAADVSKVLTSVGVEVDAARVNAVIAELNGKDLAALIASGKTKIGSAAPAAAAATSAAPAAAAAAKPAAKVVEAPKEESDDSMTKDYNLWQVESATSSGVTFQLVTYSKASLNTNHIYVVDIVDPMSTDYGRGLFLWFGKHSFIPGSEGTDYDSDFKYFRNYRSDMPVTNVQEGEEDIHSTLKVQQHVYLSKSAAIIQRSFIKLRDYNLWQVVESATSIDVTFQKVTFSKASLSTNHIYVVDIVDSMATDYGRGLFLWYGKHSFIPGTEGSAYDRDFKDFRHYDIDMPVTNVEEGTEDIYDFWSLFP
eukprot:gene6184-7162_t